MTRRERIARRRTRAFGNWRRLRSRISICWLMIWDAAHLDAIRRELEGVDPPAESV
jgi:hypothetical protein